MPSYGLTGGRPKQTGHSRQLSDKPTQPDLPRGTVLLLKREKGIFKLEKTTRVVQVPPCTALPETLKKKNKKGVLRVATKFTETTGGEGGKQRAVEGARWKLGAEPIKASVR